MAEPRGELETALRPLIALLEAAARHLQWPLLVLALAYAGSGFTRVQPDEVAVVLRFGEVRGHGEGRVHGPGLLMAWPRPFDEVVRIPKDRVLELQIADLTLRRATERDPLAPPTVDLRREGYCLTGDQSIVQAQLTARYRVADPVAFALGQEAPERLLRSAVVAAMNRSTGEVSIEDVMTGRRRSLAGSVQWRAQQQLDAMDSGLELLGVELSGLLPPFEVLPDYHDVNDAYVAYQTLRENAQYYAAMELPAAQADADATLREAQTFAARRLAGARADAGVFLAVLEEYRRQPDIVRQRLYRETLERCLESVGDRRFVPPPEGERYQELRITIPKSRGE